MIALKPFWVKVLLGRSSHIVLDFAQHSMSLLPKSKIFNVSICRRYSIAVSIFLGLHNQTELDLHSNSIVNEKLNDIYVTAGKLLK